MPQSTDSTGGYEDGSGFIGERPEFRGDGVWDVRQVPHLYSEGEQVFAMVLKNDECLGVLTLPTKADFEWLRSRILNLSGNN